MNRLSRVKFFVLLLGAATAAQAQVSPPGGTTTIGPITPGTTITPIGGPISLRPLVQREAKVVKGDEIGLLEPGIYSALSWDITGVVQLRLAGDYFVVATGGAIAFGAASQIQGPAVGTARITFLHKGEFVAPATIGAGVTMNQAMTPPQEPAPLLNHSMRIRLAQGQTLTSGFVVGGTLQRRILIRAVGPTLANFGIQNPLATPTLTVFDAKGTLLYQNSGWTGFNWQTVAAAFSAVGAFSLPVDSKDSAGVMLLGPGSYTAQVNGGAGEVLLEIYLVE